MSNKKEKKQKKERSKKDWKVRRDFLKDLLSWWELIYPKALEKKNIKRYMNALRKRIKEADENSK